VPTVLKSGNLELLEPSGLIRACTGIALPLPLQIYLHVSHKQICVCVTSYMCLLKTTRVLCYTALQSHYSDLPTSFHYTTSTLPKLLSLLLNEIIAPQPKNKEQKKKTYAKFETKQLIREQYVILCSVYYARHWKDASSP
jgi:hypothetical protein